MTTSSSDTGHIHFQKRKKVDLSMTMPEMVALQHGHAHAPSTQASSNSTNSSSSNNSSSSSASGVHAAHHHGTLSDAEAREWWTQREAKVERELYSGLQKRMDTQRKQVHAFKLEQAKWENELQVYAHTSCLHALVHTASLKKWVSCAVVHILQLKIKKFAHDRKLLSEHNIELQEALTSLEEKYAKQQSEMDSQTTHIIALESLLREKSVETQELHHLRESNEELSQVCSSVWVRFVLMCFPSERNQS